MISFLTRSTPAVPRVLFVLYLLLFAVCAINPVNPTIWFAENLTVVIILIPIIALYLAGIQLSNLSYLLMSVLIYLHTIGGHYTFAEVPFDALTDLWGGERNNYDRIAHFTVGFYAFPIAELFLKRSLVANKWVAAFVGLLAIAAVAGIYEIIEWLFAIWSNPNAGAVFLGSQGDEWDAQKDMFADISGAVLASGLFLALAHRFKK